MIDLKKKVGPLPTWGWAALGAGTLGLFVVLRRRKASAAAAAVAGASGTPVPNPAAAANAGAGAGAYGTVPYIPTGNTSYYVDTVPQGSGSSASNTQAQAFQTQVQQAFQQHLMDMERQYHDQGTYEQAAKDNPAGAASYAKSVALNQQNEQTIMQAINQDIAQLSNPTYFLQAQQASLQGTAQ
jgi:hypothetical protein